MTFKETSEIILLIFVVALAIVVLHLLLKRKLESNLPLIFYGVVIAFMSITGRPLDAPLVLCGLGAVLVLRFEFMNKYVTNAVLLVAIASIVGILLQFVGEALGINYFAYY